jgi:acylphosphatase
MGLTSIARGADGKTGSSEPGYPVARIHAVSAEVIRRRIVVHGRVQGVFFRDSVRQQAAAHGLSGTVRNRDDGTVEVALEGMADDVQAVVEFCRQGPEQARVNDLDVREEDPEGLSGFEVL